GELLRIEARHGIDAAACREADEDANRSCRIIRRRTGARRLCPCKGGAEKRSEDGDTTQLDHESPFWRLSAKRSNRCRFFCLLLAKLLKRPPIVKAKPCRNVASIQTCPVLRQMNCSLLFEMHLSARRDRRAA